MLRQQRILCSVNRCKVLVLSRSKKQWHKKKEHWAEARRKNKPVDKAMKHFDDFYLSVFGEKNWRSMRVALLCPNKYCAVVNNFGEPENTKTLLENRGAINLKALLKLGQERISECGDALSEKEDVAPSESSPSIDEKMQEFGTSTSQYTTFYYEGPDGNAEFKLQDEENPDKNETKERYREKFSLCESLEEAEIDETRIIDPSNPLNASSLYEFVPATKLHGMDDWVPESQYYDYYKKNMDFPIAVEDEQRLLTIPDHLNVYLYEKCNTTLLPTPEKLCANVLNYYILNGSSVLPILALDLQQGDKLLDMCAAPGGKAITAIQSLCLDKITLNEKDYMRTCRIYKVVNEYLYGTSFLQESLTINRRDALTYSGSGEFNKVIVDVPCTNDRNVLTSNTGNLFHSLNIKERLRMPELQSELLTCALKLIPIDGTVVYSTCSLSPVQNDGVVQMALKKLWDETDNRYVVKNIQKAFKPLEMAYCFGSKVGVKYGLLVLPNLTANFGPLYVSKIVRTR